VFDLGKFYQVSKMFSSKAGAYPNGALAGTPFLGEFRLNRKQFSGENTLAYFADASLKIFSWQVFSGRFTILK
jgi:hypothetical protein